MKDQQKANKRRAAQAAAKWAAEKSRMIWLYEEMLWSQAEVAAEYGISQAMAWKLFRAWGVSSRSRANSGQRNGRYKDGTKSTAYRKMVEKEKCANCGKTWDLVIHHVNGEHTDNRLTNLQVLCSPCHSSYHKTEYWRKKKSQS